MAKNRHLAPLGERGALGLGSTWSDLARLTGACFHGCLSLTRPARPHSAPRLVNLRPTGVRHCGSLYPECGSCCHHDSHENTAHNKPHLFWPRELERELRIDDKGKRETVSVVQLSFPPGYTCFDNIQSGPLFQPCAALWPSLLSPWRIGSARPCCPPRHPV
jgi:hypothetical protein